MSGLNGFISSFVSFNGLFCTYSQNLNTKPHKFTWNTTQSTHCVCKVFNAFNRVVFREMKDKANCIWYSLYSMYGSEWVQFSLSIKTKKISSSQLDVLQNRSYSIKCLVTFGHSFMSSPRNWIRTTSGLKKKKNGYCIFKMEIVDFSIQESMAPISIFNRQSQINIMSKLYLWLNTWIGSNKRAIQMFNYIFGSLPTSSLTDCSSSRRKKK